MCFAKSNDWFLCKYIKCNTGLKWVKLFRTNALFISFPTGNYMFKVNNIDTRARREICSKSTIMTPELHP